MGYEFEWKKGQGYIAVRNKRKSKYYNQWKVSVIEKIDRDYHIINNGILTRRDFTVLFENEEGKYYLPIETMGALNVYSDVTFSSGFFEFANKKRL